MNKNNVSIRVHNSQEWQSAVKWLLDLHQCSCCTIDCNYPKWVYYQENGNCLTASQDSFYISNNYSLISFKEAQELFAPNPYAHLEKARKEGKIIEYLCWEDNKIKKWGVLHSGIQFVLPVSEYRIKVAHQHLLDALAEGKTIQYKCLPHGNWVDIPNPTFDNYDLKPERYQIKPNPYQVFVDAMNQGKVIQASARIGGMSKEISWIDINPTSYYADCIRRGKLGKDESDTQFRIKPEVIDPYKVFKDAIQAGKQVQYTRDNVIWEDCAKYYWNLKPTQYRIKPETPLLKYNISFECYSRKPIQEFEQIIKKFADPYLKSFQVEVEPIRSIR